MDDVVINIPPREIVLRKVLQLFHEFGHVSNLRHSVQKGELLALEQPAGVHIQGITVVHKPKFPRVLGGDLQEGQEYADSMNKIRFKCKKIGSLAIPLGIKIHLVHQWVSPKLYNVVKVVPMPKKVVVHLKKFVRLRFNITSLTVSMVDVSKSMNIGIL